MAAPRVDIISIGTLSRNRLWNEAEPVRTPHATTTLIRSGKRKILVDPGLPAVAIAARLAERTGVKPDEIDSVFLTNFKRAHRAGLAAFPNAKIFMHEVEQQSARAHLDQILGQMGDEGDEAAHVRDEIALLDRITPADDKLADHVDLFPLFGYTAGSTGLLVTLPTLTILVAGDAVPTQDHFMAGQVLPESQNVKAAQESMQEIYEIADLIIPGHDNLFLNPRSQGM
jgi:glyoxylase-like metal-dependent hydrolase (beta-lactamase superfamily II)